MTKAAKETPQYGQVFLKLPIELQLCTLEHSHPYDLYTLSTVSKRLRRLVMAPNAAGVWKLAFERHEDLPKPPPGVAESDWAFLLYGPGICGECGKHGALTDFGFLKHYCEACMKIHYAYANVLRDGAGSTLPTSHQIWDLIPRSFRYNGLRYTTSYPSFANAKFLRENFQVMFKKWSIMELLVEQGVPGLSEYWEDYKQKLIDFTTKRTEAANKVNNWAVDVYRNCSTEYDALFAKLGERAKNRLQNYGHDPEDINAVSYFIHNSFRQDGIHKFTPKAFRLVKPKLEQHVITRKEGRLKQEREKVIENIYTSYLRSQEPDKWQYLPQPRFVKNMDKDCPLVKDFLTAPFTHRGDIRPGDVVEFFPAFANSWTKGLQEEILAVFSKEQPHIEALSFDDQLARLDLATTILTCTDCKYKARNGRVLIGWDNICRHRRSTMPGYLEPCGTYEVNDNAVAAAASLVSCVGLDPSSTTAKEMDERDDRFLCGNCMPEYHHGVNGLKVYSWFECVQHTMEMNINVSNAVHETPSWLLLTPEATRYVREHEKPHPHADRSNWRCNLCSEHYFSSVLRLVAVEHAKKVHCIANPVVGEHIVMDLTQPIRRRKPFLLGTDPSYDCRCLKCPEMSIYKLWTLSNLTDHLRTAHKVETPAEGTDYKLILTIAATPTPPAPQVEEETIETTQPNTDQPPP
ncbi:hypothetical protein CPB83DRAFT_856874 [Crepidotus variabilis]|uniref:F-box domain-containing protein n=1 Tax=Crepidotus variabilis TaxID=179855 RepID=A0A9P6JNS9_9AGAR|nr:hypothetical protein CPB83DRAFT_856874 [Crepidotus variabilis]